MVKFINTWVQGIIIAVIISTIIEMILPDGNVKKYIRTVIGAYIVFVIVSPIVTKLTGKEIGLSTYKMPKIETYQVASIDTNSYIESTYIDKIKQEIIESVKDKGYNVTKIDIEIEKEEENYGNINKMDLYISNKKVEENNIKPIEIDIGNKINGEENLPDVDTENLKKFLEETYGIAHKNIYIRSEEQNV